MKKKGFTLVELLVVIGIIAVLMGILLPALSAVRRTAQRVVCGSNLAGLGKAMLLYANEYGGDFPRASGASVTWGDIGYIFDWTDQQGNQWGQGAVTITTSLYLLVKYADCTPAQFVCKGDGGTREFSLSDCSSDLTAAGVDDVTDAWDFGGGPEAGKPTAFWPGQYNSYAYHNPYSNPGTTPPNLSYAIRSDNSPATPVCADRNPYWDKNANGYIGGSSCTGTTGDEDAPSCTTAAGYKDDAKTGNAAAHQRDGQNVLFVDTHVRFEKFPNVGIGKDNIWKCWNSTTAPDECVRQTGEVPLCGDATTDGMAEAIAPYSEEDAFLVSETNKR